MCFFQPMILRPHPHFTFENTQVRRSAFYRRPQLPGTARSRTAMALGNRGYPVVSIPTDANTHTSTPLTETETMYNWKHSQTRNIRSVRLLKMSFVVYTAPAADAWFIRTAVCSLPHGQRINAFPPLRKRYQTLLQTFLFV